MPKEQPVKIEQPEVKAEIDRLTRQYLEKLKERDIEVDEQKLLAMKVDFQERLKTKGVTDPNVLEAAGNEFMSRAKEAFKDQALSTEEIDTMAAGVFARLDPEAAKGKEGEKSFLDTTIDKVKKALKWNDKSMAWAFAAVASMFTKEGEKESFLSKTFREMAERLDPTLKKTPEAAVAQAPAPAPEAGKKTVELSEDVKKFVTQYSLDETTAKTDYPKLQSGYNIDAAKAGTLATEAVKENSRLAKLYAIIDKKMGPGETFVKSILDLRFQDYKDEQVNAMIVKINGAKTKTDANFRAYLAAVNNPENIEKATIA